MYHPYDFPCNLCSFLYYSSDFLSSFSYKGWALTQRSLEMDTVTKTRATIAGFVALTEATAAIQAALRNRRTILIIHLKEVL